MKQIILVLVLMVGLIGCKNNDATPPQISVNDPIPPLEREKTNLSLEMAQSQSEKVVTVPIGGVCDNQSSFCGFGAECRFSGPTGQCTEKNLLDIECSADKAPVCGYKDGQKLGYLNECEARRHQAEIVSEGLCEIDTAVKGSCSASVTVIGNCNTIQSAFEFQADTGNCVRVTGRGCTLEAPFEDVKVCLDTCS